MVKNKGEEDEHWTTIVTQVRRRKGVKERDSHCIDQEAKREGREGSGVMKKTEKKSRR